MKILKTARALLLGGAVLMCATAHSQNPIDVHKLADAVDKHYNDLRSLQSNFEESYSGGGMTRNESGVMFLKKPGKMRWDYKSPREKMFLTDGKTAWFYVPGEKQARRASVKSLDDLRSPLRYLLGKTKLEKEFEGLSLAPDKQPLTPGNYVLRGIPKSMADRVSQVLLEITPESRIARILIEELDGSTTEFRFQGHRENVQVADEKFRFSPPPGVEVMQAKELEP
jgi:outer membrane lipoprotein carrier protein